MTGTDLLELAEERAELFRLTVTQYHQMIEHQILPEGEPFELPCGAVVRKIRSAAGQDQRRVAPAHCYAVQRLMGLKEKAAGVGCHIRTQLPVTLPPYDEPEPDGAIVKGTIFDYRTRHPGAADVKCVIEVADSSLSRDRKLKMRIYARAGIAMYVILNLPDAVAQVYSDPLPHEPCYANVVILKPDAVLEIPGCENAILSIEVREFLI